MKSFYNRWSLCKTKKKILLKFENQNLFFLLDEEMKVEKSQYLNQAYKTYIINKIVSSKLSYIEVAQNSDAIFSKSTVHRVIKNAVVIENHLLDNFESCEENNKIIVNVDDTFNSLLVENSRTKSQFQILNFYQEDKNQHKINETTVVLIRKLGSFIDFDWKTKEIVNEVLITKYSYKNNKRIVICGDGVRFIQTLAKNLKAEIVLDKWHCFKLVSTVFNSKNLSKDQVNNKTIREVKKTIKHKLYDALNKADIRSAINIVYEG